MKEQQGYVLIILVLAVFVMSIGLMVAVPVWQTQIQREKEEELIFRGKQYVEAIRLFQMKKPGAFPKDFEELSEENCLRKPFKDPMTKHGQWNVILRYQGAFARRGQSSRKVMIAPQGALSAIDNPQIIGVVSASSQKSIKIYYKQQTYDKWLFYYGQDPNKMPEIVYYGEKKKD